jgi:hypothetical protein
MDGAAVPASARNGVTHCVLANVRDEAADMGIRQIWRIWQMEAAARAERRTSTGHAAISKQAVTTFRRQAQQRRKDIEGLEFNPLHK